MKKSLLTIFAIALIALNSCIKGDKNGLQVEKFAKYKIDTVCYMMNNTTKPCLKLSVDIEYPNKFKNIQTLKFIQKSIVFSITGDSLVQTVPNEIKDYENKWINDYKELGIKYTQLNDSLKDLDIQQSSFYWKYNANVKTTHNQDGIYSTEISISTDIGSGQGSTIFEFLNFDLINGKLINTEDIIAEKSLDEYNDLILRKILTTYKLKSTDELYDTGFYDVEEIKPTDNFSISDKGITLTYNQGEIAAYALGTIKVFIPYKDLVFIAKTDSPISQYIQ